MSIEVNGDIEKRIKDRVTSGAYASIEDVLNAALSSLEQNEKFGEFDPGEMDALIDEGHASGPPLDGETVLRELRELREKKYRKPAQ